jgi:hypothetical protein
MFDKGNKFNVGDWLKPKKDLGNDFVIKIVAVNEARQQYTISVDSIPNLIHPSFDHLHFNYYQYTPNYNKIWNGLNENT